MNKPAQANSIAGSAARPTELAVTGMTCGNCARHVTEAIQSVPQVASAAVRLEAGRATVRWDGAANTDAVIKAVTKAGYEARILEAEQSGESQSSWSPLSGWRFNVVAGLAGTLPLMAGEWIFHWGMQPWFQWTAFALSLLVQIFCGARFYLGAWRQLKVGDSNMDTLVALGSTTAFGYSAWALFSGAPGHLYFMESAAIITLISLGHWFEARTSVRAESALQALLQLAPKTARRRNADGTETDMPVAELQADDLVVLKPGDQIPVDGQAQEGEATVDESMLTGESLPVEKSVGDNLYAGTLNVNGRVILRVKATGEATALAHIIAAVTRAQNSRANIQRLGDRVSSVFVPVVVVIALGTALWWGLDNEGARHASAWLSKYLWNVSLPQTALAAAFIQAAAVLIIACPCAMGLATPVAIMAGANAAARRGILVRDGIALERAGEITAIVFDKTGTLTQGKPAVAEMESFGPKAKELAAALARRSNHPISQAVAKMNAAEFSLGDWEEMRGSGVQAQWEGQMLRLGSWKWLRETGIDLSAAAAFETKWSQQGATLLGIVADKKLLGALAVTDALKADAAAVVEQLRHAGMKVYLLTGDNRVTAQAIAQQAGIAGENIFAEVRPEEKAKFIQKLQQQGERVGFVGDGINDAPALEAANLGIAVSRASDVAREAADIILLKSDIQAVPEALGLARATLRTIKQNLFWAFVYNVVGIPLAALGFMSPVLCAAAMGVSDLIVIGNALRLLRWKSRR
jgi:Cu+-exporting ATPase